MTHVRLAVVLAALALAAPAAADPGWSGTVPAKARALAEKGRAFHDAGDYASAIAAFNQAYAMAPSPALLFNLAQAYRLAGNCDDAALMYERYLATNPTPEGRALAATHLANVERCMHKLGLGIPVQTASVTVAKPSVVITAQAPSRRPSLQKDIGLGFTLGGSVALAGALYYALDANSASSDVSDAYTKGKGNAKNVGELDDRGHDSERKARILAVGGGIGVATGVVLYVLGRRAEASPVAITPTAGGARVSMGWAF